MRTRHLVVPLLVAAAGLDVASACNCDEVIGAAAPDAVLVFAEQEAPPAPNLDVALAPGAIGTAVTARFAIENRGNRDLVVSDIVLGGHPELCPTPAASFVVTAPGDPGAPRALTLPPDGTVDVVVQFTATSGQPACVVARVLSNDSDSPELLARISGQGDAPQLCANRGVIDFGTRVVGDHVEETVTLTSCGTRAVQLDGASLNAQFPEPFELVTAITPRSVEPDATVDIVVAFDPDAPGQFIGPTAGTIDLDTDLDGLFRLELIGTATLPPACRIQVIPSAVQFGTVGEGFSSEQTVVVRNIGELDCTFTSADVVGGAPFSRTLVDLTGGDVLGPQQFGSVKVTFAPTTAAGRQQDVLRVVTSDAVNPTIDVPLEGSSVVVPPCFLQALPTALNFGNRTVRRQTEQEVRVKNIGTETCIVSDITISPATATEFGLIEPPLTQIGDQLPPIIRDLFPFGAIIPAGEETAFIVSFRPESPGPKAATAVFTYKEQGFGSTAETLNVPLSGVGVAACLTVTPVDVDFGTVAQGSSANESVQVANCGGADLVVRGLTLRSGSHPDFALPTPPVLPATLAPGATTTVTVRAAPTAQGTTQAGAAMFGVLDVLSDAGAQGVNLRANAAGACVDGLVCSPRTVDFGEVILGEDLVRSIVCNNPTTAPIAVTPAVTAPFTIVSAPASIPAGGQGVVRVRFDATSTNLAQQTLTMGANDCQGAAIGVAVRGRGVDDELPPCPTPQAFTPETVWDWNGSTVDELATAHEVWVTPLVARLEDTTGDGFVTRADMPRVIFSSFKQADAAAQIGPGAIQNQGNINDPIKGYLRAVDGATGREVFTVTDDRLTLQSASTPAVVDLDGDGNVEIIANKWVLLPGVETIPNGPKINGKFARGSLIAFNHDGTVQWESDEWTRRSEEIEDGGAPAVGDVDGDGFAEIALGDHLFDHNGRLLWRGDGKMIGSTGHGPTSVLADVDGRPGLELVAGPRVFRADGTVLWTRDDLGDGHPAVADLNGDGKNEVVIRSGQLYVLNGQTGATLTTPFIPPTQSTMGETCQAAPDPGREGNEDPCNIIPTNPSILDFDGDGSLEIFSGNKELITGYRFTGSALEEIFRANIYDGTGASGPAGFDFEGDGAQEVVYSDEGNLFTYAAPNATTYSADRQSVTIFEYSPVADINLDGHAEMLVASNSPFVRANFGGVRAYRNAGTSWAQAKSVWNQHGYLEDLVGELGTPLFASTSTTYPGYRTTRAACVP